jgi:hypothetical protein
MWTAARWPRPCATGAAFSGSGSDELLIFCGYAGTPARAKINVRQEHPWVRLNNFAGKEAIGAFFDWIEQLPCGIDLFIQNNYRLPA